MRAEEESIPAEIKSRERKRGVRAQSKVSSESLFLVRERERERERELIIVYILRLFDSPHARLRCLQSAMNLLCLILCILYRVVRHLLLA